MLKIQISVIKNLKNTDLVAKCRDVVGEIGEHVGEFPSPVPALSQITNLIDDLDAKTVAAQSRARQAILERNMARTALLAAMDQLVNYVALTCQNKVNGVELVEMVGLEVWASPNAITYLPAPGNFTAETGEEAGQAVLRWKAVYGTHMYQVEFVEGTNNGPDANWQVLTTCSKARVVISQNLESGKYYSFRVRALGSRTVSAPSDAAVCIVP